MLHSAQFRGGLLDQITADDGIFGSLRKVACTLHGCISLSLNAGLFGLRCGQLSFGLLKGVLKVAQVFLGILPGRLFGSQSRRCFRSGGLCVLAIAPLGGELVQRCLCILFGG